MKNTLVRSKVIVLVLVACIISNPLWSQENITVESPDGDLNLSFFLQDLTHRKHGGNSPDGPHYKVYFKDKSVILPSRLGFNIGGKPELSSCFKIIGHERSQNNSSWEPVYGERDRYPDHYNELKVTLKEYVSPNRELIIHFRMYNEGVAIRYSFPSIETDEMLNIVDEFTEFNLSDQSEIWGEYGRGSQGTYLKQPVGQLKQNCELPLLAKSPNGWLCIAETGNDNYPRSYAQPAQHGARYQLRGEANLQKGELTPWRVILVGETAGELVEHNYLLLNLNEPNKINDVSWIKPGKIIRDNTLSTIGAKQYIDYASGQGISGVILDWGWYGIPFSDASDATTVDVVAPMTAKPIDNHTGLSIEEVVEYGKSKGVNIWLYVNYQALERQVDELLPLYQSWGIVGIKPGFVRVANQEWEKWLHTIVRKAAMYHLMVDPHDQYRPSGFSRTYPNLMTQEGIHGNEESPDANHNTTLPFTRFVIGAGDYTPGYCKQSLQTTFAHRLALPILFYSPAQFLFWGERIDSECHYSPELKLWKELPTIWDDTKVLGGEPGEFAIIARKSGNTWYVGAITNNDARNIEIPLEFLESGKKYSVTIYSDGGDDTGTFTNVKKEERKTASADVLKFSLKGSGGVALKIVPQ